MIVAMHEHGRLRQRAAAPGISNSPPSIARSARVDAADRSGRRRNHSGMSSISRISIARSYRGRPRESRMLGAFAWSPMRPSASAYSRSAAPSRTSSSRYWRGAQIRQQQKSALRCPAPASSARSARCSSRILATFKNGPEILLVGRRIHHDVGVRAAGHAKISAKTRIRGRRCDRSAGKSQILESPIASNPPGGNRLHPIHPCLTIHRPQMRRSVVYRLRRCILSMAFHVPSRIRCLLPRGRRQVRAADVCPAPPKFTYTLPPRHRGRRSSHSHRQRRRRARRRRQRRAHRPRQA